MSALANFISRIAALLHLPGLSNDPDKPYDPLSSIKAPHAPVAIPDDLDKKRKLFEKMNPKAAGWADPATHPALWGKSDPINPSFIPSWDKGLFREGIFDHNGFSGPHNGPIRGSIVGPT